MHKSNYDKASEVAMGKLRPKPDVSITISMKGGGGLSSLGDFPIIRRFMGSYTDEMAGVEPDTTGVDWTVDGGADILGGQQRGKDQARQEDPNRDFDDDPLTIDEVIRDRDMEIIKGQGQKPGEDYRDYLSTFSPRDLRLRGTGPNWSLDEAVYNLLSATDKYGRSIHSTDKIKAAMDALEAERLDQRLKEEERPEPERFEYTPKNYSPSGPLTLEASKGGGLLSLNENKMPIIRRFAGSYTDADAGVVDDVDMYGTDTPGMTYTEDDFTDYRGADMLAGQFTGYPDMLTGQDDGPVVYSEAAPTGSPEGPATGGLSPADVVQYGRQFKEGTLEIPTGTLDTRTYNTYLNDLIERTGNVPEAERLLNESLKIPGAAEDMQRAFDAGIGASFRGEGYRYGGPAGTLMDILEKGVNYDFGDPIKKRLQEREKLEKEGVGAYGYDVETMKTENTFGSILDKIGDFFTGGSTDPKTLEGIQSDMKERGGIFTPISTSDKIVEGAVKAGLPGLLGTGLSIIQGLIGRPIGMLETPSGTFYVGKDGSLANASLAASPNLGNEPAPKRKRKPTTKTKTTTEDIVEEEKTTPTRGEKRLASLGGLQDIFRQTHGRPFRTI